MTVLNRRSRPPGTRQARRKAIALGYESASISRRVIGFLTHDHPSDALQARAEQTVQHAKDVFERAVALVGDDVRPAVTEYISKARELMAQSDAALVEKLWRRAIALAHKASRVLYHLIRILS